MREQENKHTPTISVIMGVYNEKRKDHVAMAIDSVLEQSLTDFEFIICDDGSTDGTWGVLKQFAAKDSRIQIIRNEVNQKSGYARNRAIELSSGKYIAIMDADDVSHLQRFEKQAAFLDTHSQHGFVGSYGEFFHDTVGDEKEVYRLPKEPLAENMLFSLPFIHASCMFRREVLEKIGGYDIRPKRYRVEDYDLLLRVYEAGYSGANIPEVLYYIRRDEAQYKRRKYRYRFNEASMKYRACRSLKAGWRGRLCVVKPLVVGLMPIGLLRVLQNKYYHKL